MYVYYVVILGILYIYIEYGYKQVFVSGYGQLVMYMYNCLCMVIIIIGKNIMILLWLVRYIQLNIYKFRNFFYGYVDFLN